MPLLTALVSGLLFGAGLALSGMVNPAKVLNFLDVAGTFDPTLVLVLGGAVVTTFIGYRLMLPAQPLFAERFQWPTKTDIDGRLVAGAAIFGVGWGLSGFCPGPALGAVVSLRLEPFIFIAAMAVGILGVGWFDRQGAGGRVAAKS
jgi:uncharacterized protein